jgi:hypothetical protein
VNEQNLETWKTSSQKIDQALVLKIGIVTEPIFLLPGMFISPETSYLSSWASQIVTVELGRGQHPAQSRVFDILRNKFIVINMNILILRRVVKAILTILHLFSP